jgi:hypothetical protein
MDWFSSLMAFLRLRMRNVARQIICLGVCGTLAFLSGCGPKDTSPNVENQSPTPNPDPTPKPTPTDLAPASIGDNAINGRIGSTATVWQIVTTGGATGTFNYSENGKFLDNGSYTWTKTSADTATLRESPDNNTIEFTYTGRQQGTYLFHPNPNYTEIGTFTTTN